MPILSNEEKLDLFFNTIKEQNLRNHLILYYKGLYTQDYPFSPNEAKLYIERFYDDGLINFIDENSFIITPKGKTFQGYQPSIKKVARSIDYIKIYTLIGLGLTAIGTVYTVVTYYKPNQTDVQLQLTLPVTIKIDSPVLKSSSTLVTTIPLTTDTTANAK